MLKIVTIIGTLFMATSVLAANASQCTHLLQKIRARGFYEATQEQEQYAAQTRLDDLQFSYGESGDGAKSDHEDVQELAATIAEGRVQLNHYAQKTDALIYKAQEVCSAK